MKGLTVGLILTGLIGAGLCHTYHLGECPVVEPKSDFHMSQFLGLWYAIQKTSTGSRCLTYNFTVGEEPGEYFIEQVSEHPVLGIASVDNKYHYTGSLKASLDAPARMTVKFPLNIAGTSSFIVFSTDYNTYAGIYTCQKLPASNRRSVTILSRRKTLDKQYVDKVRNTMSLFGISPFDLSIIDHTKCPKVEDETYVNVDINPETLSAKNIGNVVRKTGEKLGDGVTSLLGGGGKANL
ncbi:apolipoprotein D-like [Cimex lectularius]|uniref:Lipocalin/cytosolic fatty-acid binding domain-containing protein n=1 Tax=Cimex lectularius TaxID=79782 RepID=A0A8I6TGZ3_CIMLE|nr:apolipoprotein D-like [Cimex lectularius]